MAIAGSWVPSGNDQPRLTGQMRSAIAQLQAAAATLGSLKNIMAQMVGGGTDYSTIETYFAVGTGYGQTLHDVLGTASDDLQGSNVQGLLQRFG
jgi:hypothetical protein